MAEFRGMGARLDHSLNFIGIAFALIVVMDADAWYVSIEYMSSSPFDTPQAYPLLLYGAVVGVSLTQLFWVTLLLAFFFIVVLTLTHMLRARYVLPVGGEKTEATTGSEVTPAAIRMAELLKNAESALLLPILVLGGIYSGFFTPTDTAVYAILLTVAMKAIGAGSLSTVFFRAGISSTAIMFVIGLTSLFNKSMILEQVPQTIAAVLLMGPLLAPAAASFGIDSVHFGIIVVINIETGLLTPRLYVAAMTNRISFLSMMSDVKWFLLAALVVLVAITYLPDLSLWYRLFS